MRTVGFIFGGIAVLVILSALCFGLTWVGIEWDGFFGAKRADVERKVFRNTRSYDEGMVQQLTRFRLEYIRTKDETEKAAVRSTVRMMFAEFPIDRLTSPELRAFLTECRNR